MGTSRPGSPHPRRRGGNSRLRALAWSRRARLTYDAYRAAAEPFWVKTLFAMAGACPQALDDRSERDDPLYRAVIQVQRRWSALPG